MSEPTFTLLHDVPIATRKVAGSVLPADIDALTRKAERLECEADDLRNEASEAQGRAERIWDQIEALRKKGELSEFMDGFLRAARQCSRLDWHERELIRQAIEDCEWNNGEMIHLGLLHALPVPFELFPQMTRRAA